MHFLMRHVSNTNRLSKSPHSQIVLVRHSRPDRIRVLHLPALLARAPSPANMSSASVPPSTLAPATKVWLITGCSSGLGQALALAALARGDRVIVTARNVAKLADLEQRGAAAIALDVTSPDDVLAKTAADAVALYGRIDILVNNAGYALQGAVEECRCVCLSSTFAASLTTALLRSHEA